MSICSLKRSALREFQSITEFKRGNEFPLLYLPSTFQVLRLFLAPKNLIFVWIVCQQEQDIWNTLHT